MFDWLKKFFAKLFGSAPAASPSLPVPDPISTKQEPERPSVSTAVGQKLLLIPFAQQMKQQMKTRGTFRKGYPEGAIVHYTAGRWGTSALNDGLAQGYLYLLIDEKGVIYQSFPLNKWGYHAGVSSWPTLGNGVSQFLVGIEIACAGKVEPYQGKFKSWFGALYTADQVRSAATKHDNIQAGSYQKYTEEQEQALIHLLLWLKQNNPDVFSFDKVLGHDEVAPTRKSDPGASLSCSMPEFRQKLKDLYGK